MKRISYLIFLFFIILIFSSCVSVDLPENRTTLKSTSKDLKTLLPKYPENKIAYQEIANEKITNVKEGDTNLYGILVTQNLKDAYDGYLNGNGDKALDSLNKISKSSKDSKMLWQASFLKIQTLIMMGLGDDALDEIETCKKYEMQSFNSDLNFLKRYSLNLSLIHI